MPDSLQQVVRDPDFRGLPLADQRQIISELDPDYASLSLQDQEAIRGELVAAYGAGAALPSSPGGPIAATSPAPATAAPGAPARQETSTLSNLGAGALGSIAGADRLAANALDLVGIDSGAEYMRGRAATIEANAAPLADETLGGVVAQAIGGAPVGVLEAVAAASAGGPVAGFAGLGALSEADKGWMAAAKAALEGGAVGKATKLLGNLPAALRVPAFAALFGGQSYFDTGDPKQALAGAITGAGLALPGVLPGRAAAERPRVEPSRQAQPEAPAAPPPIQGEPLTAAAPAPPPEAFPGRGFRVDVSDPTPRFNYNPSVLGPEEHAFVARVLTDPVGAAQQEVTRRGTMTRGQVADLSEKFPLTFAEALALPQGTILPVEGQQRLAEYGKRAVAGVHAAAAEVQAATRAGDAVGEAAARAVLDARSAEAGRLIMAFEAQGSEVGRALGIRAQGGISATHAELLARRALRMVMDGDALSSAQRDAMAGRIIEAGSDPAKIVAAVRDAYTPGWWAKLQELRVNFLIANPPTVLRNIVGNGVGVANRLVENAVGIPIDLAYSAGQKVGVLPRGATEPNRARAREMAFDIFGTLQGTFDGIKLAARSLTDEDFALTQGRVGAEVSRLPAIGGRTGQVVRIGTRIQSAADLVFRAINETGELYRQAARSAYAERQSGPGYAGRVRELVAEAKAVDPALKQRIAEGKVKPKTEAERIAAAGHNVGLEFTYQLPLGEFARKIDSARSSDTLGGHVAKTLVPFFRTPLNLGKFVAQRAPVTGWFSPRNLADIRSGNRELAVQSMARIATGTALSTGLLALAQNGLISGAPPDDLAAREAARRSGWRPWSINVHGEWLDYRGYSPISEQLAIVAGIAKRLERPNGWREADATDLLRVGTSIARTMVDQPYFTGVADVIELLTQTGEERQERGLVRFGGQLESGFMVPRVVAWLARSTDPLERAPADTVGARVSLDVPGEREKAPAWRDPLGRAYETPNGALGAFVRHSSDGPTSPLDAWLFAIHESPDKAVVGYPARTQLGRRLSAADWERFMVARGELLIPVLEQIRQAPKAKGGDTPFAARAAIDGVERKITNITQERVLPDAELRALGIEPTSQAWLAVLAVMRTAPVRAFYEAKGRSEDEKRQILELVSKATSDPSAGAALRQMIVGPETSAPASGLQPQP